MRQAIMLALNRQAKAIAILRSDCTGGPTTPDPRTARVWRCDGLPALFRYVWPSESVPRTTIEQIAKADLKRGRDRDRRQFVAACDHVRGGRGPERRLRSRAVGRVHKGGPGDWFSEYRCGGPQNLTGYCSRAVDALLRAASGQLDPSKRARLYGRADAVLALELPGNTAVPGAERDHQQVGAA